MIELPDVKHEKNYPLAWLIGEFEGSGQLGGHFGLADTAFEIKCSFKENKEQLDYSFEIFETETKNPLLKEQGVFRQIERPESLVDEQMFAVEAKIQVTTFLDSLDSKITKSKKIPTYSVTLLGLIGKGKLELVSDKIELEAPETKIGKLIVNDLWREKRLFGWVNQRVLFATDLAFLGTELESFIAGGMWKSAKSSDKQ